MSSENKSNEPGSEKTTKIHQIIGDNSHTFFISSSTQKEELNSMLVMLRLNHLLGSNPSHDTIPSEQDAAFILSNPHIDLRTSGPGLFNKAPSINKTACDILNKKTAHLSLSPAGWKYNKTQCCAWIEHDLRQVLEHLSDFLAEQGIIKDNIQHRAVKETGKPILVIKYLTLELLDKLSQEEVTVTAQPNLK